MCVCVCRALCRRQTMLAAMSKVKQSNAHCMPAGRRTVRTETAMGAFEMVFAVCVCVSWPSAPQPRICRICRMAFGAPPRFLF